MMRSATMRVGAVAWRRPTTKGVKELASEYGRSWLAIGGIFGAGAAVNPAAAACVGSMFAAAHVVDLAVNDDLDDLQTLPRWMWSRVCGRASERKRVVVLGTGWGALSLARKLDAMVFDVTIVSPRSYFFYTPMLAGVTTGTVKAHSVLEAIRQTAPMPHATYLNAECTGVDPEAKIMRCQNFENSLEIPYDHLVVAVGAQPNTFGTPGVEENAMFLKELNDGLKVRQRILNRLEQAVIADLAGSHEEVDKLLSIAVVGGGPTGVEFAAEVVDFINSDVKKSFPKFADRLRVTLVEASPALLPMFEKSISEHVKDHLGTVGVDVRTDTSVKSVDSNSISMTTKAGDTQKLDYGLLVWVAGIGARPITKTIAAAFGQSNPRGLEVDERLRVKGAQGNEVFALGDCAVSGHALTAQVAAQQGKYLGRALRDENADASSPFVYGHQGTMAYVGKSAAVAVLESPPLPPALGKKKLADFSFWRQLASCPDGLLKPEHRTGTPVDAAKNWKVKVNVLGISGFAIWRGVYFTKLFSYSNRFNVATDWIRNFFFGRVVASSFKPQ